MGSKNTTTTTKQDPWKSAQGELKQGMAALTDAYNSGQFNPAAYAGLRVAAPSGPTSWAQNYTLGQAYGGSPLVDAASGGLKGMMQGGVGALPSLSAIGQGQNVGGMSGAAGTLGAIGQGQNVGGMSGASGILGAIGQGQNVGGTISAQATPHMSMANFSMKNAMLNGLHAGNVLDQFQNKGWINSQLQAAQKNALGAAVPAAVSQFAGSGMANSSTAMDTVGRAATEATAPYSYDAMNQMNSNALSAAGLQRGLGFNAASTIYGADEAERNRAFSANQNQQARALSASGVLAGLDDSRQARALSASGALAGLDDARQSRALSASSQLANLGQSAMGMAPAMELAQYLPGQMAAGVGAQRDAYGQALIDANMARYYEQAQGPGNAALTFSNAVLPYGGQGSSSSNSVPGPSLAQKAGAGITGGLGMYGALATNPVTAPFAIAGGLGAGLMGLF